MKLIVFLSIGFCVSGGYAVQGESVFGGSIVKDSSPLARSTVEITFEKDAPLCSGTLLAKNIVMTAAHCFFDTTERFVHFGIHGRLKPAASRKIVAVKIHETFYEAGDKVYDDIALIRFSGSTPNGFLPAQLPPAKGLQIPKKLIAAGYGLSDPYSDGIDGNLRMAALDFLGSGKTRKTIIVDQNKGKGICTGDSGGSLYINTIDTPLIVVGIASSTEQRNNCTGIGIFTEVSAYLDWIKKSSEELSQVR
jgi:secreted trypsin-like serine protease